MAVGTAHTENAAQPRRPSHMSVEGSVTNGTSSGDDISETSTQEAAEDDYDDDDHASRTLSRHISHASSIGGVVPSLQKTFTQRTNGTSATNTDPAFEVDFEPDSKNNPQNWSLWYKGFMIFVFSYSTTVVLLFSTSYTSAIPGLEKSFGIDDTIGNLGLTTYLLGIAVGALVLAPLSEMYGRRPIYIIAFGIFTILVIPCAVAKNIETILIIRFFAAFCAAAMISNAPGSINDFVDDEHRALAFSIWSIGPLNGPVIGPVVGGFVYEYLDWRWTNWVVLMVAGVAWVLVALLPETYAPAILRRQAVRKRKETGDDRWWSNFDEKKQFWPLLKINLSRPFILTVTEPICIFWDIYIALVYGILYLCFVAYPIVFEEERGWSPGFTGLAFCGIGVGSMITIACEPLIRKMIHAHKPDPVTGRTPPEAMVSVVCIAACLIPIGEIWFAWTGTPNCHWILPILAGIPFGAGNSAVFIYANNYLVYSYDIYAASALAGNAVLRSVMGATLPLAGPAMYKTLGAHWAGTMLGLMEVACIPIPFIFYRYGSKIREKSRLIRSMREDAEKRAAKKKRLEERAMQRANAEAQMAGGMPAMGAVDEEAYEEEVVEREEKRDVEKAVPEARVSTTSMREK